MAFDFGNNLTRQFIVAQSLLQLSMLYLRISMETYYNRTIKNVWVFIEAFILIFSIGGVIEAFLDTDSEKDLTGFIFCLVLGPIAGVAALFASRVRLEISLETNLEDLKKEEDVL